MVGIQISSQFCGFQHFSKSCCKSRTWLKLRGKKSISLRSNGAVFGLRIINPCNIWQLLASFTEALASKDFDLNVVRTWYLVSCILKLDCILRQFTGTCPRLASQATLSMDNCCSYDNTRGLSIFRSVKNSLSFVSRFKADNDRLKTTKWRPRLWQFEFNARSHDAAPSKRTCSLACCRSWTVSSKPSRFFRLMNRAAPCWPWISNLIHCNLPMRRKSP